MAFDDRDTGDAPAPLDTEEPGTSGSGAGKERRRMPRNPFPTLQRIAPWDGVIMPRDGDFFPVQCHDLSPGGFAFLLPVRPTFRQLVAELLGATKTLYLAAEVCHTAEVVQGSRGEMIPIESRGMPRVAGRDAGPGRPAFLVGCRFLRRLRTPRLRK